MRTRFIEVFIGVKLFSLMLIQYIHLYSSVGPQLDIKLKEKQCFKLPEYFWDRASSVIISSHQTPCILVYATDDCSGFEFCFSQQPFGCNGKAMFTSLTNFVGKIWNDRIRSVRRCSHF